MPSINIPNINLSINNLKVILTHIKQKTLQRHPILSLLVRKQGVGKASIKYQENCGKYKFVVG